MVRDELSVLSAFLAVAEERSFTRAAKRLGVSSSALSHAIRGLEERIGVRLLARTTRSVAPTNAGEQLIARLGPALGDIRGALARCPDCAQTGNGRAALIQTVRAEIEMKPLAALRPRASPDLVGVVERHNPRRQTAELNGGCEPAQATAHDDDRI
jgi:DNA-binding transcriptional LysR family regulator